MFEALNLLGTLEREDDEPAAAAALFEQALAIGERILEPNHEDLASVLKNLGDAQADLEQFGPARRNHERALARETAAIQRIRWR